MSGRKSAFIECECGHEAVSVEYDSDNDDIYLSIWERGLSQTHPWRYRLRAIWRILRHGTPYGDCVILSRSSAEELASALVGEGD